METKRPAAPSEEDFTASDDNEHQGPVKKKKKDKKKRRKKSKKQDTSNDDDIDDDNQQQEQRQQTPAKKEDTSRIRKKKRKKATKHRESLLTSAESAQFTGSVVVDRGDDDNMYVGLQLTTTAVLPKASQLKQMRMFATDKPAHIYTQPLLILDLNGILCHRVRLLQQDTDTSATSTATFANPYRPSIAHIANTDIIRRPNLFQFITFLDQHFCLAIWTSAQPKTATQLVNALLPPQLRQRLLFVWNQTRCKKQKKSGPILVKPLGRVWKEYPIYGPNNTYILDDSPEKHNETTAAMALHPPPMDGLKTDSADPNNHARQQRFFEKLVQFWETNQVCTTTTTTGWDEELGRRIEKLEEEPDSVVVPEREALEEFLQENATEHMGWTNKQKKKNHDLNSGTYVGCCTTTTSKIATRKILCHLSGFRL